MPTLITALLVAAFSFRLVSADLSSGLNGAEVNAVFPGDSNYADASRAYNLRFTLEPAAVAYPTTPEEVSSIIQVGVDNNLKVVARSGGHSYAANGLGGQNGSLVIDMSNMKAITIDSSANTAVIETGNRLGDVALALNAAGRALPHGTCPYVGIGGHSAFGGYGFTSRLWGLALDPIFAINAVLANGTIVRATEDLYPDIFWALKGAAPSFAITTSVEVNTFAAPSYAIVMEYSWSSVDYEMAGQYLYSFQNFSLSGPPSALAGELVLSRGSEEGQVTFALTAAWYGDGDEDSANSAIQPFLDVMPTPTSSQILGDGSYIDSVSVLGGTTLDTSEAPDITDTFYAKSIMTPESEPMTLEACTSFMQYLATEGFTSNTAWFTQIELYGGPNSKIREIPNNATAFSRRDTLFTFQLYASSSNSLPPYPAEGFTFLDGMVSSVTSNMPETWNYGAYTNYLDNELENWQTLYFNDNYPRLKSIKDQVDPADTFWFPTSIEE
ncbi:glucooligosaccharide oxidase [Gymnopus androsaceus JB14]|uniref:Glucooligosaccharide oxidase n=1 Tax=Gymnopus androsaceus JB14 TaxID=1447944 RepID=A0A6A4GX04_9AGAR|nr:glucooligosaccharide oxidase [Gymnopus androsaceus JB14]